MQTYIALLRGVNVSGQKKVPMVELRELISGLGFKNVRTYNQSGNILFQFFEENLQKLEQKIHQVIKSHFGFAVSILIQTREMFQNIFDACPFPEEKKVRSYFMLLYDVPTLEVVKETLKISCRNEAFIITDFCVYFYSTVGYGKSKYNNNFFERTLKVTATTRNFKTMVKLLAMSEDY